MSFLISFKAIIVIGWFVMIFIAERVYRAAAYPKAFTAGTLKHRLTSNITISLINMVMSPLLIIPLTAWISFYLLSGSGSEQTWRPEWMLSPWFFIIDLIILDCFLYWWHRFNHRIPFLWRFHEVHHLDEFLDSTTALRFHFGEVLLSSLVRVIFIVAFAIPLSSVILFEIILMACTIFNHSNLRLNKRLESYLSKVIVTPSIHWVHHHAVREDTDSNYATIFSVWDKLFNTRNKKLRWDNMKLGVENLKELNLKDLLLRPLRD